MPTCPALTIRDAAAATILVADGDTLGLGGAYWSVTKLDGWWDSAPVKAVVTDAQPEGQQIGVVRRKPRAVVVELMAHSLDRQAALGVVCFDAADAIRAQLRYAVQVPFELEVDDGSTVVGPLHSGARIVRPILAKPVGAKFSMRVQLAWQTTDPFLYDASDQPYD